MKDKLYPHLIWDVFGGVIFQIVGGSITPAHPICSLLRPCRIGAEAEGPGTPSVHPVVKTKLNAVILAEFRTATGDDADPRVRFILFLFYSFDYL